MKYILLLLFLITACSNRNDYDGGPPPEPLRPAIVPAPRTFTRPGSLPQMPVFPYKKQVHFEKDLPKAGDDIDFIFSIDNSGSMDPFIEKVEQNITILLTELLKRKVNFQTGILLSTEIDHYMPFGQPPIVNSSDPNAFNLIVQNIKNARTTGGGSEWPISIIDFALNIPANVGPQSLFRPEKSKVFFILSDASDLENNAWYWQGLGKTHDEMAQTFADNLTTKLASPWLMINIGTPKANPCRDAETLEQPIVERVTKLSGGKLGRICDPDYHKIMLESLDLISGFLRSIQLGHLVPPDGQIVESTIVVKVNGTVVAQDPNHGWTFDPILLTIRFHGNAVLQEGDHVEVDFDAEFI